MSRTSRRSRSSSRRRSKRRGSSTIKAMATSTASRQREIHTAARKTTKSMAARCLVGKMMTSNEAMDMPQTLKLELLRETINSREHLPITVPSQQSPAEETSLRVICVVRS